MTHLQVKGGHMRSKRQEINDYILQLIRAADGKAVSPIQAIQQQFTISRQQAYRYLQALVVANVLQPHGQGRGRGYVFAHSRILVTKHLSRQNAEKIGEDKLFSLDILPALPKLNENIISILNHGFTEMVNNVIDHSQGSILEYSLEATNDSLILKIQDNGIGIFRKNMLAFACEDLWEALVETVKGKRTSAAKFHSGEGVFFTSRLFDRFVIKANGIFWNFIGETEDWTMGELVETLAGTSIIMGISTSSTRKPEEVFRRFTDEDFKFNRGGLFIVEPLTLKAGLEHVSRSEAKRLLAGADAYQAIIVDFKNTRRIGQGFADEVFRVFPSQHQGIEIRPINMQAAVEAMVRYVLKEKKK
jgi:anti-sigma regulatory factor (Ser/Thr protein kinase)